MKRKNVVSSEIPNENLELPPDFVQLYSCTLSSNFDSYPDPLVISNKAGNVIYTNFATKVLMGKMPPPTYSIFNDPDAEKHGLKQAFLDIAAKKQRTAKLPNLHHIKNFDPRSEMKELIFDCIVVGIYDSNDEIKYYFNIMHDITLEKKLTSELQIQRDQLAKANKELLDYQANLEHEISLRTERILKKEQDLQYSNIISMISSTFLSTATLDVKITNSLRTLGEALQLSMITVVEQQNLNDAKKINAKWWWNTPELHIDLQKMMEIMQTNHMNIGLRLTPEIIYEQMSIHNVHPLMKKALGKLFIASLLTVPVIRGEKFYGYILLTDKNDREFTPREISMALQTAMIIGLALKTFQ